MKTSEKPETLPTNEALSCTSCSCHTRRTLGVVGEGLDGWSRSALELDPRACCEADSSMKELQAVDCPSDTEPHELWDKECLRLDQVTSIDVKCGLVTLSMQDDTLRRRLTTRVSSLDMIFEVREEVRERPETMWCPCRPVQ